MKRPKADERSKQSNTGLPRALLLVARCLFTSFRERLKVLSLQFRELNIEEEKHFESNDLLQLLPFSHIRSLINSTSLILNLYLFLCFPTLFHSLPSDSIEFVCTRLLEKHGILNENALPHLLSLLINPSTQREQFDFIKRNVQNHLNDIDSGGGFFASLVEGMVFSICQDLNALFQEHLKLYPSTALWSENLESFHNYLCAFLVFGGSKRLSGRLNSVDDDDSRRTILNRPIHLSKAEVGMVLANALGNQNVKLEFLLSGKKAEAMQRDDLVQEDFRTKGE